MFSKNPKKNATSTSSKSIEYYGFKRAFPIQAIRKDNGKLEKLGSVWTDHPPKEPMDYYLLAKALFEGTTYYGHLPYIEVKEVVPQRVSIKELKIMYLLCAFAAKTIIEAKVFLPSIIITLQAEEQQEVERWHQIHRTAVIELKKKIKVDHLDNAEAKIYGDAYVEMKMNEEHLLAERNVIKKSWNISDDKKDEKSKSSSTVVIKKLLPNEKIEKTEQKVIDFINNETSMSLKFYELSKQKVLYLETEILKHSIQLKQLKQSKQNLVVKSDVLTNFPLSVDSFNCLPIIIPFKESTSPASPADSPQDKSNNSFELKLI